jgi:hypothetical protein
LLSSASSSDTSAASSSLPSSPSESNSDVAAALDDAGTLTAAVGLTLTAAGA